jgi:V-type H+-transporting ATPase subunit d
MSAFHYARETGYLTTFRRYSYMIDNIILLITGTLHERDTHELLERCHPLGVFESMPALCVATTVEELYQSVLVETPLGTYRTRPYHPAES